MTGQVLHTTTFPFNCTFVPKGCRVPREERVTSRRLLSIPTLNENEVKVAYRITQTEHEPVRILSFEGQLWWPLNFGYEFCLQESWAEDFLEQLETDATWVFHFLKSSNDPWRYRSFDEVVVRSLEKSDEDQVLARIQRTISEHILIVGDRVFGRGGQPLYLCEPPGRRTSRRRRPEFAGTRVASAGADRAADYVDRDFREAAGCFGDDWVQERLRRGEFHLIDQVEATLFGPPLYGLPAPTIERLAAPCEPFDAETIRLDALFRQARNFLAGIPADGWVGDLFESQRAAKDGLRKKMALVEEGTLDPAISAERLDCLKQFLAFLKDEEDRMRIRPYFKSIAREIEDALPHLRVFERGPETLSAEDEAALAFLL
ncbi:hypothetical protein BSZ19_18435 [Bradyrhizobium japonicum]|uniref:Uncharacterized protein n=1 Tax=Bradyrhizobium japonicum TaxID=375 RepID=A0A1Y2JNK5_BRAJP|nr:hypothetical protein [Bradyrhizobium japonicum]OSJ32531.1 hypothetical protein BSZ19_18435 [Bradyrhizobium japonicum]